jgi:hypothetical protein
MCWTPGTSTSTTSSHTTPIVPARVYFNLVPSNHEEVAGNGNSSSAGVTAHAAGCMLPLSVFK